MSDVEDPDDGHAMTWLEIGLYCAKGMQRWDTLQPVSRLGSQIGADPHYKPIAPGSGLRARRRHGP